MTVNHKKLSCHRRTVQHAMSVIVFSTAAQLYKKSHLDRLALGEWPWILLKILPFWLSRCTWPSEVFQFQYDSWNYRCKHIVVNTDVSLSYSDLHSIGHVISICLERGANDLHRYSWCHCHSIISCSSKIQNGLPFWCRLTQVVLEKGH